MTITNLYEIYKSNNGIKNVRNDWVYNHNQNRSSYTLINYITITKKELPYTWKEIYHIVKKKKKK